MAQTVLITLTIAGDDTGPFNLYSNIDGFAVAFETNVSKIDLEAGYVSVLVPDSASTIRVQSDNAVCDSYIDLIISTTTTTTSAPTTTTSTTTGTPTTTTTTTALYDVDVYGSLSEALGGGGVQIESSLTNNGVDWANVGAGWADTSCTLRGTVSNIPSGSTLYLRVLIGPSSPIEFGGVGGTNICPGANSQCILSFVVAGNMDAALTVNVISGNPIGC